MRLLRPFLQNTSGLLLLFYNSFCLYTLQLYIAASFKQWKVISREKDSSIYLTGFTNWDFFYTDMLFHFLWQMSFYLVDYAKRMPHSEKLSVLLARRHLNRMLLINFENLNSISNMSQETHDFLVFIDPVIICIYLRSTDRHFHDQGNVRHPTSKLRKYDLIQILNNLSQHFFADFCCREGISCLYWKESNKIWSENENEKRKIQDKVEDG